MQQKVPVQFEEHYPPLDLWVGMSVYPTSEGGLAVFFRDITEHKHAEQFRERLMGIVSHDLRSPLHSISLNTELLLRREDVSEPVLTGVRRIARSTERMSRMITDLLDFTRARLGGGIPLQRRPGHLVELVRATLEEFEVSHPGRVVLSHEPGPYSGEWDPDRLAQVISNLVGNALHHGAGNTPVEVALRQEAPMLVLTVHNQGAPIPEALLPPCLRSLPRCRRRLAPGTGPGPGPGPLHRPAVPPGPRRLHPRGLPRGLGHHLHRAAAPPPRPTLTRQAFMPRGGFFDGLLACPPNAPTGR